MNKRFLEIIQDFYKDIKVREIVLTYEGEVTHDIIKAFSSLIESRLYRDDETDWVHKRVYHVLIECLQNISRHAFRDEGNGFIFNHHVLLISKSDGNYQIVTGNVITNNNIDELKQFLDHVNSLSREGLDDLFKKQLRDGVLSDKGGAGLGFIDIRRKTSEYLDYHFFPIDDENHSFFMFTATIPRKKKELKKTT